MITILVSMGMVNGTFLGVDIIVYAIIDCILLMVLVFHGIGQLWKECGKLSEELTEELFSEDAKS